VRLFRFGPIARAIELGQRHPKVWGNPARVRVHSDAALDDPLINVNSGTVTVEAFAGVAQGAMLLTGTHDFTRFAAARHEFPSEGGDIIVGYGAWIASGAIVLGPCRIGKHAVVAAGAVVTSDVEPYTVVAGVPARVIRTLSP
jgi:acetyltransferase-like isoleucine patch superfamily enzyme